MKNMFNSNAIHWIWCLFIIFYIAMSQYTYAISDKQFVVNHDYWIYRSTFQQYNEDPSGHILSLARDLFFKKIQHYDFLFVNLIASLSFYVFGRTLFVFKMTNLPFLIVMALSVYFISYRLTRKEIFGILASLILVSLPVMINNSRTQFAFIPLTSMLCLSVFFIVKNITLDKKVDCVFFSTFMCLSVLVHPSAFLFYSFIYLYFLFAKKSKVNFSFMLVFFLLVFAWRHATFMHWFFNETLFPSESAGRVSYSLLNRAISSINMPYIYFSISQRIPLLLLNFFIANIATILFIRIINLKIHKFKRIRVGSEFKFIFIFISYVFLLICMSYTDTNIDSYLIFFILFVVSFVSLLFLIGRFLSQWPLAKKAYLIFCFIFIFHQILFNLDYLKAEPLRTNPIRIGKGYILDMPSTAFDIANKRLRFSRDMTDISHILFFLNRENREDLNLGELHILESGVILYKNREKRTIGKLYPVYSFWGEHDDHKVLYDVQAFYKGLKIKWRHVIMYLDPEEFRDHPMGTFKDFRLPWGFKGIRHAKKAHKDQLKEDISKYRYMFFTVLKQCDDKDDIWNMPDEKDITGRIEEINPALHDKFFKDNALLTKLRIHKNLFLYVYKRGPAAQGR